MKDELERRRDECIQLRTMLSARSRGMSEVADESYGGNPNILNEDGELEMAYKTQKDLNKYDFNVFVLVLKSTLDQLKIILRKRFKCNTDEYFYMQTAYTEKLCK